MAYQGEDIDFDIKLWEDDAKTIPINIDNLLDLYVYAYTTGAYTIKLSKNIKVGFNSITRINATQYRCTLTSDQTRKLMPGQLLIEIQVVRNGGVDGRDNKIAVGYGDFIKPCKSSDSI